MPAKFRVRVAYQLRSSSENCDDLWWESTSLVLADTKEAAQALAIKRTVKEGFVNVRALNCRRVNARQ